MKCHKFVLKSWFCVHKNVIKIVKKCHKILAQIGNFRVAGLPNNEQDFSKTRKLLLSKKHKGP